MKGMDINMNNHHALPRQEKWIKLSIQETKHIFTYYFVMFIMALIGASFIIWQFIDCSKGNIGVLLINSFAFGLLGSTFYYIRKLYKSCIQCLVDTEDNDNS